MHRNFQPEHEKELLYYADDSALEQIAREVMEYSSLGILKNHQDAILGSVL